MSIVSGKRSTKLAFLANSGIALQYIIIALLILLPVVWMVTSSFKPSAEVTRYPPQLFFEPIFDNYVRLFDTLPYALYTMNSVIVAGGSTVFGLLLAVPAAFAVSWYKTNWPASVSLMARMAPGGLYLLPWYIIFNGMGLQGSYVALILTHTVITMPITLWIMSSFFDGIPRDVLECGLVDGMNLMGVIRRIAIPLAAPGMVVSVILTFILSWNYFLFALVLSDIGTTPLTVAAFRFVGEGVTDWGMLMAAATVLALPPLVLAFLVQRWLVHGLTFGAVKG
ncbi:MAG: ABC transporter permease subunit [Spirochaetes bacterium]|jgi:multiple sugar transport system permease protein|nr:ABC transporter permease subunit [Spirochaetota bacterium]